MDRREFMKTVAAASLIGGLEGCGMIDKMKDMAMPGAGLERRELGSTGERLSMIGFGGIIVMNETPETASNRVAEAFARGVNYFDVAPSYGNAIERLGPALRPWRDRCFLACKTTERGAAGAEKELNESLKVMQTDHFDLYQLHAITTLEDVEKAFAPGGAMEVFVKAREAGKVRFIGFSAHSEKAAHAAMDRFDFDTILFPFNYALWLKKGFGPSVLKRAREKKMGLLALKALAQNQWPKDSKPETRRWNKCWYQPLDEPASAELALRFTLGRPVDAALPPGHWELFAMALELAEAGKLTPLGKGDEDALQRMAETGEPLFSTA